MGRISQSLVIGVLAGILIYYFTGDVGSSLLGFVITSFVATLLPRGAL